MRELLHVVVPGKPHPLMRSRRNGTRDFDPPENRAAKERLRWAFPWAHEPYEGPVEVEINCHYKRANPTADVDNLAKTVLDALNRYVIKDDRQVVVLSVMKLGNQDLDCTRIWVRTA